MDRVERQCTACRKKGGKSSFIRIVKTPENEILIDPHQNINGRGVYFCPQVACIVKAHKADLIAANFKIKVDKTIYIKLAEMINSLETKSIKSLLGMAKKSGRLVLGLESVRAAINKNKARVVVISPDISGPSREKLEKLCSHTAVPVIQFTDSQPMDVVVGKVNCRAVAITDKMMAEVILSRSNYRGNE